MAAQPSVAPRCVSSFFLRRVEASGGGGTDLCADCHGWTRSRGSNSGPARQCELSVDPVAPEDQWVGVGVERTFRPNGGKSHDAQRFDRPLPRVVGQFDDLICDGPAEAETGPGTRTVGLPEHHPPLVALGAIILRSPRFDTRLYPEVLVRSSTTGASASSSSARAPHHDAATENGKVGGRLPDGVPVRERSLK